MFGSKKQTLSIDGMMCEHCAAHVKAALEKVAGVEGVKVDLKGKCATVKTKADIDEATYRKTIEDAGYKLVEVR